MVRRSVLLLSAASSAFTATEETRIGSAENPEDKQFWIGNRFRRPFPLRTRHKPYLPRTIQSPQAARDAADRFLFGWNQGNEAAILRLMATGAFVEDYSMLSLPVLTDFGSRTNTMDYDKFRDGKFEVIRGFKNVTAFATAMSCMTRKDVTTDDDCCKARSDSEFCVESSFKSTEDKAFRVVETSFTGTSDGFVTEYKYVVDGSLEFDFAAKATVDNYGRFRRISFYSTKSSFLCKGIIHPSACGGDPSNPPPNEFCSVSGNAEDMADVCIGEGSCSTEGDSSTDGDGSCILLGADVIIGDNSCNGDRACREAGEEGGAAYIGDNSCNGDEACYYVGEVDGYIRIGDGSCNGYYACDDAAYDDGYATIGDGSCLGAYACEYAGEEDASATIGDGSCNGDSACYDAAYDDGYATIGDGSCNGASACQDAAESGGSATIGRNSCNGASACNEAGYDGGAAMIGDNSCLGEYACDDAGENGGSATIGDNSCLGEYACQYAGENGSATIGDGSCTADNACEDAGSDVDTRGAFTIGNDQCTTDDECKAVLE